MSFVFAAAFGLAIGAIVFDPSPALPDRYRLIAVVALCLAALLIINL